MQIINEECILGTCISLHIILNWLRCAVFVIYKGKLCVCVCVWSIPLIKVQSHPITQPRHRRMATWVVLASLYATNSKPRNMSLNIVCAQPITKRERERDGSLSILTIEFECSPCAWWVLKVLQFFSQSKISIPASHLWQTTAFPMYFDIIILTLNNYNTDHKTQRDSSLFAKLWNIM